MKLQQKNLDIYGSEPLEWTRAVKQLEDTSGHRPCASGGGHPASSRLIGVRVAPVFVRGIGQRCDFARDR
jgi:hypothetical protein